MKKNFIMHHAHGDYEQNLNSDPGPLAHSGQIRENYNNTCQGELL